MSEETKDTMNKATSQAWLDASRNARAEVNGRSQFAPILEMLEPVLKSGVRQINIWDGGHCLTAPRDFYSSRELNALLQQFGQPLYAIERSSPINGAFDAIREATSPEERNAIIQHATEGSRPNSVANFTRLLQMHADGRAEVFSPDARTKRFEEMKFTREELDYGDKLLQLSCKLGGDVATKTVEATLSDAERLVYESYRRKITYVSTGGSNDLDMDKTDAIVVRNIENYRKTHGIADNTVQVTMFGALHFMRPNDLDEAFPGISIMITDRPGGIGGDLARNYRSLPVAKIPHYVWYSDQQRLVKLDTKEAVDELITLPESQEVIALKSTPAEAPVMRLPDGRFTPAAAIAKPRIMEVKSGDDDAACSLGQLTPACAPASKPAKHEPNQR